MTSTEFRFEKRARRAQRRGRFVWVLSACCLVAICGGANDGGELQYKWRIGEQYAYSYSVTLQSPSATFDWTGGFVYAASKPIRSAIYEERVTTTKLYRTWPVCD